MRYGVFGPPRPEQQRAQYLTRRPQVRTSDGRFVGVRQVAGQLRQQAVQTPAIQVLLRFNFCLRLTGVAPRSLFPLNAEEIIDWGKAGSIKPRNTPNTRKRINLTRCIYCVLSFV